jgi:hypothetical protein
VKYLSPWRPISDRHHPGESVAIYKLGEKDSFIRIVPIPPFEYSTDGLLGSGLTFDMMSFRFNSLEQAKTKVTQILIDNGFSILTEEQFAKLEVLA